MSLKVLPLTAIDIPTSFQIRDRALAPSQAPLSYILFNRPATSEFITRQIEILGSNPNVLLFKAVENETMIAWIRARRVPQSSSPIVTNPPEWQDGCGMGKVAWDRCWKMRAEARKECFENVDHIYVDLLATDPKYQRRGAGACLLKKLADMADESSLPIFLVSTEVGRRLYEKAGFGVIKEVVLDLEEMGETRPGREIFTYMIRQPRKDS